MEYLCKYSTGLKFCWVDVLEELTHCDSGYDVTIAAYSLTELYLPKMENVRLFVAPESKIMDFPVLILCNVCLLYTSPSPRDA